jgi:UDP-glucose 4-epimerase
MITGDIVGVTNPSYSTRIYGLIRDVSDFAVFGDDAPKRGWAAVRDCIHVDDFATAHVVALSLLLYGNGGRSLTPRLGCWRRLSLV